MASFDHHIEFCAPYASMIWVRSRVGAAFKDALSARLRGLPCD